MGVVDTMWPVVLPALAHARARHHVVRLVSNVSENSNMWPLYPGTLPLLKRLIVSCIAYRHASELYTADDL